MKPIFSIHAGEYLVGTHIEQQYKNLNIWLPSKDTGIDLLITDQTNRKTLSIQVKFSKDYLGSMGNILSETIALKVKSSGWWKFNQNKVRNSQADLWVLVLYRFTQKDYDFVVIEPKELSSRYEMLGRKADFHSYILVTSDKKCWETRGLKKREQVAIANGEYFDPIRDLSVYLNNWSMLKEKLL